MSLATVGNIQVETALNKSTLKDDSRKGSLAKNSIVTKESNKSDLTRLDYSNSEIKPVAPPSMSNSY